MTADQLESEFTDRRVPYPPGGIFLLLPPDAIALIDRAAAERVAVLGLDGFWLRDGGIQPDLEHAADYSGSAAAGAGNWAAARDFIRSRAETGLVFEVVLADHQLPAV